jgi:YhcH/YjgK/YiaL family protein
MIHDTIANFRKYQALNPRFGVVADWLEKTDLSTLECGKHQILPNDEVFVNVQEINGRLLDQIPVEAHRKYTDVQIPIDGEESMGWLPAAELLPEPFDAERDVVLTRQDVSDVVRVRPGEFIIFTPDDAHAPGCCNGPRKKLIVKVLA